MEKLYTVYNFRNNTPNWGIVPKLFIDEFPWYEQGMKQQTMVQAALSKDVLYFLVEAEDAFIRAETTTLNEPVYHDSCFEFFVSPTGIKGDDYFNIEISCNGTLYLAYRDNTESRMLISEELSKQIHIKSTIQEGKGWSLEIRLPLSVLEQMSHQTINERTWYANFYRCGGMKEEQYACWNKVQYDFPSFHQPKQFGKMAILAV